MKGKESHCMANFATFVLKWMFQNGCNKVVIELSELQFWSEIILKYLNIYWISGYWIHLVIEIFNIFRKFLFREIVYIQG